MRHLKTISALGAWLVIATAAQAGDYCCACKGEAGKTIDAPNRAIATAQCSLQCKDLGPVTGGKCAAPASAAPASTTSVLLYKSDDCSGDPAKVSQSAPSLKAAGIDDIQSMSVESGGPAIGWEKPDFGGRGTGYMAPTICVAPGFEIQAVRVGGR
jgi:hypothetical protein